MDRSIGQGYIEGKSVRIQERWHDRINPGEAMGKLFVNLVQIGVPIGAVLGAIWACTYL